MRIRMALLAAAAAGAVSLGGAHGASAQAAFGSAAFGTYRECVGNPVCDGAQTGQTIIAYGISGGTSSTSNTSLVLNGTTGVALGGGPVALPNDPASNVSGIVAFGGEDLPVLHGSSNSGATDRMGINAFGYQTYTNTGDTTTAFDVAGALHIDSFSGGADGTAAGGAIAVSYLGVWDPSLITSLGSPDALTLFDSVFEAPCGATGVLAANMTTTTLVSGVTPPSPTLNGTTGSCSGAASTADALMLAPGQTVLVVAGLQLLTNRGGQIDASDTFTTTFTPDVDVQELASGRNILGVPEPATWALMIAGFGLAGAALRRQRQLAV
ncbi:PEPxxWA-CTERM sorting domain-containing protein [Phenylobacterium sp.]|jgi:hypothetical protein|uniref:PEPxxWA-CTERM sorting domain-containing protein n=1 Tax=Phenylobacterium sp. TaxID=1871053 RepID=UPI002F41DC77